MKNLLEELEKYSVSDYYPFHMPGHKRLPKEGALACYKRLPKEGALACYKRLPKEGAPACSKDILKKIYPYDITEIEGFDNLHDAGALLLSLQEKAAHVYHAEQTFFLVNGSTGGILSAVSAVAKEGKKILIARNCHKSVYNAVLLNRLHAEYLWPDMIEEFDIQGEIRAEEIEKHLYRRQDICGVVITSPTYDGIVSDIREIAKKVHAHHIPLIVDEAHGAHFVLSEKAPESAVECGADLIVNSVHKTLPALTQTALLHVQGTLIDREKLKSYLRIYQSSSPSYLLMASIDECVEFVEKQGRERYERMLILREKIDEEAARFSCIRILPQGERRDPGKLVVSVKNTDMTGWELYHILLQKYHIQMEMAAPSYVLGILTGMDTKEGAERLAGALKKIDKELAGKLRRDREIKRSERKDDIYNIIPPASGLSIYEAAQREKEWIYAEESAGRVSGEMLYFYPPGIPVLVPGEVIPERMVSAVKRCREKEEYLTGITKDGKLCVLREKF